MSRMPRSNPGYAIERDPGSVAAVELGGVRTVLYVPMLKDNEVVGAFTLSRQEVRPFTDKQIALVTNFAAQAVIAIENARLLNELRERTDDLSQRTTDLTEALEQQTATSEVLRVISSSSGDLEPAFATMLENAVRICEHLSLARRRSTPCCRAQYPTCFRGGTPTFADPPSPEPSRRTYDRN
jgi:GAF domain-containing protein